MSVFTFKFVKIFALCALLGSAHVPAYGVGGHKGPLFSGLFKNFTFKGVATSLWTEIIKKPCQKFFASDLCKDLKIGVVGGTVGIAGGVVRNIGKETTLFSVLVDMLTGSVLGGAIGFGGSCLSRLSNKHNEKIECLNQRNENIGKNMDEVRQVNGKLQLQLLATQVLLRQAKERQLATFVLISQKEQQFRSVLNDIETRQIKNRYEYIEKLDTLVQHLKTVPQNLQIVQATRYVDNLKNQMPCERSRYKDI